ncbi:beta-ketoacyl synthase chain length factor [Campylobacter sp. RM16187]|uniref:beta-ketoacyl synthase chain length factor n=1 Tax=Campylobacter sp. RM16187 TaxID=1660063 RepID=UPI0021B6B941|nr:beta-ketoacyl synthase chain length factor [Campylobacter sp. RM16187]QKG29154.1 putative beta-ketoacyl synthase [Campylobacter sp. RM16187]
MNLSFGINFFDAIVFDDFEDTTLLRYNRGFEISHIPPLERRRLSKAAKCAFDLTKEFKTLDIPVVFSSYAGEINRCFELEKTLAANELMSPTSFSLSVHNALSSLLSISMKNNSEISAISAFAPLEYALIEASLYFNEGVDKVLVIAYHEAIKQSYYMENSASCMAALIVSKGENLRLAKLKKQSKNDENLLIRFLQNFDPSKKSSWQSSDNSSTWQWDYEP